MKDRVSAEERASRPSVRPIKLCKGVDLVLLVLKGGYCTRREDETLVRPHTLLLYILYEPTMFRHLCRSAAIALTINNENGLSHHQTTTVKKEMVLDRNFTFYITVNVTKTQVLLPTLVDTDLAGINQRPLSNIYWYRHGS